MKRTVATCLALILSLFMTVSVWADAASGQRPDYATDYYMVVESPEGGINIYSTAGFDKAPLNSELIPNGTALYIRGEVVDGNRVWGYTEYHGMRGYVPLDDCTMVTKSAAIESELNAAGAVVNNDVSYDVEAGAGNVQIYQGPGEKYGVVSGSRVLEAGEKLQITKEANLADGSHWGYTSVDGLEGWVNLERTEGWVENNGQEGLVEMAENAGSSVNGEEAVPASGTAAAATSTPTPEPTATSTPTPEPTATSTPTPEPTATSTPTPEPTATSTPTPEATATSTPTPEATATSTPTPEPTATAEPTATTAPDEAEDDAQAEEAAGDAVEVEEPLEINPLLWIGGICIIVLIILLIYHFVKKNKENK